MATILTPAQEIHDGRDESREAAARRDLQRDGGDGIEDNDDDVALFLFCNPSSGGNAAKRIIDIVGKRMRFRLDDGGESSVTALCYNLKNGEERKEGFETLRALMKTTGDDNVMPQTAGADEGDNASPEKTPKKRKNVVVVACGGDGTVKWVISELVRVDVLDVPLGIIPFGTGNDLSRVSGWGADSPDLSEGRPALERVLAGLVAEGEIVGFDTWKVEIEVKDRVEYVSNGSIASRPDTKLTEMMINYFSAGQDAHAVFNFERHRRSSRMANILQYAFEGGLLALPFRGQLLELKSLSIVKSASSSPPLSPSSSPGEGNVVEEKSKREIWDRTSRHQGVIVQNIPSYAAGLNLWRKNAAGGQLTPDLERRASLVERATWIRGPQHTGDAALEISLLHHVFHIALSKATFGARNAVTELAQCGSCELVFPEVEGKPHVVYAQIDGEPFRMVGPRTVKITKSFTLALLCRVKAKTLLNSRVRQRKIESVLASAILLKRWGTHGGKGKESAWNKRYVVVVGLSRGEGKGICYKLEWFLARQKRGEVVVDERAVVEEADELRDGPLPAKACAFVVVPHHGGKRLVFCAKDQTERDEWIARLRAYAKTSDV